VSFTGLEFAAGFVLTVANLPPIIVHVKEAGGEDPAGLGKARGGCHISFSRFQPAGFPQ
jgi:hypothetical protein